MAYKNNQNYVFPKEAIRAAKIIGQYGEKRKLFPIGAIEAAKVLRERSKIGLEKKI